MAPRSSQMLWDRPVGDDMHVRPLAPDEWESFKEIRLFALQTEPGYFSSSFNSERSRSDEEWRQRIQSPTRQAFGLFDIERLVGITAVFASRDDDKGETALLGMSFILPEYRNRGLSKLLYESRFQWVRDRPRFKHVEVSHRISNMPSRRAIEREGFKFIRYSNTQWPDGTEEAEAQYRFDLRDGESHREGA